MDSFENNTNSFFEESNVSPEEAEPVSSYKVSPFADSPYMHENTDIPRYTAAQPSEAPKPKKKTFLRKALAASLALAILGGSCGITYHAAVSKQERDAAKASTTIRQLNRQIEDLQTRLTAVSARGDGSAYTGTNLAYEGAMSPREVYTANEKSVVGISSTVKGMSFGGQTTTGTSTGSGFILTEDGYVVTNYHVIEGAVSVTVVLSSDEEYEATVVGYDSINDVAVLKIDAQELPAVTLGSSSSLYVGDFVVAIGNPLGALTATMTYGIVSGKDRQVTTDNAMINMIQTDAAINSGNSGGPLFNMYGEVIGITTAKYSGTTSSGASIESIGFAIPIDDVMSIIGDLRDFGYVTGAYLGVTVQNTDASAASIYGLPTGAYVVTVVENGSADRAGIQEKDIIIALGDYEVSNVTELTRTLRKFKAGDVTTITVIRAGERKTLDITLDEKPKDLDSTPIPQEQEEMPQTGNYDDWYKYFFGDTVPGR